MNAGTFNNTPPENIVPQWLLPCTCGQQRCHCNARFKPDILCVKGLHYQFRPPIEPRDNFKIQFIEFTFCNDRFPKEAIGNKIVKYLPLITQYSVKPHLNKCGF